MRCVNVVGVRKRKQSGSPQKTVCVFLRNATVNEAVEFVQQYNQLAGQLKWPVVAKIVHHAEAIQAPHNALPAYVEMGADQIVETVEQLSSRAVFAN